MKLFHISDVLTVTTGRLVSSIDGVYTILNFLTGDNLFTHQLPRAMTECALWLRTQFPKLFPEDPDMSGLLDHLTKLLESEEDKAKACSCWVETVRLAYNLPEMLPIYEMASDMHTHIDPIEEAEAMVEDKKVVVVLVDKEEV